MRRIAAMLSLLVIAAVPLACGHKQASESPSPNSREVTEFHAAVQDGDADIVRRLLQAKPYLANAKNSAGQSPLAAAKAKGNEEVADVIQKAGGHE